jgi:hypothetical protein
MNGKALSISGINTPSKEYTTNETLLLQAYKLFTTPHRLIREYIPEKRGVRSTFCFKVLVIIACNERVTETGIRAILNGTKETGVKSANERLCDLGLIRPVNKPRLIIPFQAYKIDKGYMITPKGKSALNRMLDY